MKKTIQQKVDEFTEKNPGSAMLMIEDMDEIAEMGSVFQIIKYAFYFGYMKGQRAKKGGAA